MRKIVDELEDADDRVAATLRLGSAEELLALAEYFPWGDGMEVPRAIMDHPQCDLGLALRLFQLADGMAWLTESHVWQGQESWAEFCRILTTRIREGFYRRGSITYDPALTAMQRHKALKAGVPEIFLLPVHPESEA